MAQQKFRTVQPPKLGDTLSVYGFPAKVVKLHGMGTVDAEAANGQWYRVTGLPMVPMQVPV